MDDKLTPMEAEVLELPTQKADQPSDFYGTAAPQATKNDHTAMWILLGLVVIAFCTGSVLLAVLDMRLSKDQQGRWTISVAEPAGPERAEDEPDNLILPESDVFLPGEQQPQTGSARVVLQAPQKEAATDLGRLYETACQSVVCIEVRAYYGTTALTGVVLSQDGYLLTASDGLSGALSITVTLPDGSQCAATRVGEDQQTGVALLRCPAQGLSPASFGSDDELQVGDSVILIGNPYGSRMRSVMQDGIVSAMSRESLSGGELTLLSTTAGFESVQHGCPIFNRYGQVVGITSPVGRDLSLDGTDPGFAVSSADLQTIVDRLSASGGSSGVGLGFEIEEIPESYRTYFNYPGTLWIGSIQSGSAAAEILCPWDVITKVDDLEVSTVEEFNAAVSRHQSGEKVQLTVYRAGRWYIATLPAVTQ